MRRVGLVVGLGVVAACGGDDSVQMNSASASDATSGEPPPVSTGVVTTSGPMMTSGTAESGGSSSSGSGGGSGFLFDVPIVDVEATSGVVDICEVVDDMSGAVPCADVAPPDSFDPEVQWAWMGEDGFRAASATPLVANLTDDNGDDEIDLCDVPDVVVVAWPNGNQGPGSLFVLDGETGVSHWHSTQTVQIFCTPAIGDVDGDLRPEIAMVDSSNRMVLFNDDGSVEWMSEAIGPVSVDAIALADVDADGDVEILVDGILMDHLGNVLWDRSNPTLNWTANTMVDLDGDDDMEIIVGATAYDHTGTMVFPNPGLTEVFHGLYPQVANLDDDPMPEIVIAASDGLALMEHDGTLTWSAFQGTGDSNRPLAIHDFDGDSEAELVASFPANFSVYEADQTLVWAADVSDPSGQAGGTAFDFLGAGVAQAMYADENNFFAFDDAGAQLMSVPRLSLTQVEYPVVADVDNDASAEVVVVSNPWLGMDEGATVQVIRDAEDRWVPARRIWNQHTYHVTNVREDGTIPQVEPKHWELLNTFRTQAQISDEGVCQPEPAG